MLGSYKADVMDTVEAGLLVAKMAVRRAEMMAVLKAST